jgi:cobyrinic acid a,c-diamide synthase
MRRDVRAKSQDGMPIVGECGGLMYLCNSISYQASKRKMVGIFEGEVIMKDKPQALSYVLLECESANPLADKGDLLRGHEFHYSEIYSLKPGELAFRVLRGKGICDSMDGIMANQTIGMYTHLHYLASPKAAIKFLTSCKAYMRS